MSFNTLLFTQKGRALQSKAIAGATLVFTKIQMGSGELGSQSQITLTALIHPEVTLDIVKITRTVDYVTLRGNFSNAQTSTGFYWREMGIFANDPDLGEILYCYANAGALAEYIPPQTAEIIEKVVSLSIIVGNTANVSATIDASLVYASMADLDAYVTKDGSVSMDCLTVGSRSSETSGVNSTAEGSNNTASGICSHAEGTCNVASSACSHVEGQYNLSSNGVIYKIIAFDNTAKTISLDNVTGLVVGDVLDIKINNSATLTNIPIIIISGLVVTLNTAATITGCWKFAIKKNTNQMATHAEGVNTIASGNCSHAEGSSTKASGYNAHSEGTGTTASGNQSHSEGTATTASGNTAHSEGAGTIASGENSHAEGFNTIVTGNNAHATGYCSSSLTDGAYSEGNATFAANGTLYKITAFNDSAKTITLDNVIGLSVGDTLNIKVDYLKAMTNIVIASISGLDVTLTTTQQLNYNCKYALKKPFISGDTVHAEGTNTIASGSYSHAEGSSNVASGICSHAEGFNNIASGWCSHTMGQYNKKLTGNPYAYSAVADAFVIGNGTESGALGNAFRVNFAGAVYGLSAFNSTGADYAEYFEWLDGNIDNEDRIGYFVTLEGEKIRKVMSADDYILGIVSACPSVIGDSYDDDWSGKYTTDEWGRIQYQYVTVPTTYRNVHHEDGSIEQVIDVNEHIDYVPVLNPDWDSSKEYIPRSKRPEWSAVGMMGKLLVRDDGSCQVNSYCKPNDIGIAIASETGFRVMKRVSKNIIRVLV